MTSAAVYSSITTLDNWHDNNSSLWLYKIGKFVFFFFSIQNITGRSYDVGDIPNRFYPVDTVRLPLININNDSFAGQFRISNIGNVKIFGSADFSASYAYQISGMYISS